MPTATDPNQDEFLNEVLRLFALEGEEWLRRIVHNLEELKQAPDADRQSKLFKEVEQGLTTLGGSAATVELPGIEKLTFALLPVVRAIRTRGTAHSDAYLIVLNEALEAIGQAVRTLSETKSGDVVNVGILLDRIAEADGLSSATVHESGPASTSGPRIPKSPEPQTNDHTLRDTLMELQGRHAGSAEPTRNVIEVVLQRLHKETETRSTAAQLKVIKGVLRELDALDEWLLAEVERRAPAMVRGLGQLAGSGLSEGEMERTLHEVFKLHEAAQNVEATPLVHFLHGLFTFLTIMSQRRLRVAPERVQTVAGRAGIFHTMVQEWVKVGRRERQGIQAALEA